MSAHHFEIRKLTIGENLDEAFKLFRHGFWRFLFFQVLIYLPSIAVFSWTVHAGGNALLRMLETQEVPSATDLVLPLTLFLGAMIFIHGVVGPISSVALTRAVADTYLGRRFTVRSILLDAIGAAPRTIAVGLGVVVLCLLAYVVPPSLFGGGTFLLLRDSILVGDFGVIALWIGVVLVSGLAGAALGTVTVLRYSVALTAVAVENADFTTALRRSATLVSGHYVPGLVLFIVQVLFSALGGFLLSMLAPSPSFEGLDLKEVTAMIPQLVRSQIVSSILGQVAGMFVGTYSIICWTLFYFTLRCEKEGFDLSYLAERLSRRE
jgi:hypothetical protein